MKTLYLTRGLAKSLASELTDYIDMHDVSGREVIKGFKLTFGDNLATGLTSDSFEVIPIPDYLEINDDE